MKRTLSLYCILAAIICLAVNSCWKEDIPETGGPRHQVTDLKAVPGDEEVQLSWSVPEGWNPTEYIISYTKGTEQTVRVTTQEYSVTDLVNGENYEFSVQAVYGTLISNAVTAAAKPTTARLPVKNFEADASDATVSLTWTRPSQLLTSYTLTWFMEGSESDVQTAEIEADKESHDVTGLTNDKNYTFTIVANYPKGASESVQVKAMPTLAIPYTLDRTTAAINQPIRFTFNTEGYPNATNVKWTFPDGKVLEGTEVSNGLTSTGIQQVILSADIKGKTKTWTLEVQIRQYVIFFNDWDMVGTSYEGFKGSCPVFSPDGKTVYDVTFNKRAALYAFDVITGELKWKYVPEVNSGNYNPLTVNPVTGDIYYGTTSSGQFYAVTSDGNLKWQFKEAASMQSTAPAVNAAGTEVYIGDKAGNIFALDAASGAKKWQQAIGTAVAGLLVNGSELVVGAGSSIVFLNIADGSVLKTLTMSAPMVAITGFAVAADKNTMYVPVTNGLSSVDLAKKEIIVDNFVFAGNNPYEPVVAPNGTVFVGCKDNHVYNLDKDLTKVNWSYEHILSTGGKTNAFNFSRPCVDTENHFYITSGQAGNTSYIFNSDGTVKESWSENSDDTNQKQMCGNNLLDGVFYSAFIGSAKGNGLLVGKYVGGQRASGWSTHGGDICGSCCIK